MCGKRRKNGGDRYSVFFGFEKGNDQHTGFLKIRPGEGDAYEIVPERESATEFAFESAPGILDFVAGEDALSAWSFHIVNLRKVKNDE